MAQENDEVQHNGNCNSSNNSDDAITTAASMAGVVNTEHSSGATTTTAMEGDEALAKDKVNSGVSDLNGGGGGDGNSGGIDCDVLGATTAEGKAASCLRGKLNDLVADLRCTSVYGGATVTMVDGCGGGIGDYTNIRATSGPTMYADGSSSQFSKSAESTWDTAQTPPTHVQAPTQNSSFSFKHFLNSSNTLTAPSSTVTSLDASSCSGTNSAGSASATNPLQTSTGARPKVPQSASLSATSISSLTAGTAAPSGGGLSAGGGNSATKMKRSPKFSSFDSQASLAEYAAVGADSELECANSARLSSGTAGNGAGSGAGATGSGNSNGFRLYLALRGESSDFFDSRISSNLNTGSNVTTNPSDFERQYVPRSYSNYDMPMPPTASPRRRAAVSGGAGNCTQSGSTSGSKDARPTRLAIHVNTSKLKLDLPLEDVSNVSTASTAARPSNSNNAACEFPAAPSAALPDFVQDHWMDSWYAHDNLNSPPNSPIRDFGDDVAGGRAPSNSDNGLVGGVGAGANVMGLPTNSNAESTGNSKMLPDFLSDGPIIHSSQRLADVAVGLPSNSIGSPDDPPITSQLSRMRIENERLQRELSDARASLSEQNRRVNELERQLQEVQRSEAVGSYKQNSEEMDKSKKRTAAAQSHVVKLKHQVIQLTAEVETLRRENELLREEGAVGGCSVPSCERTRTYSTEAAAGGVRGNASRTSRTQQISRDLRRAASNAENNLRQLLAGVDNLRQMAADIETSELRSDYDVSPDLFSDFLDDCDAYEEYPGGHAL